MQREYGIGLPHDGFAALGRVGVPKPEGVECELDNGARVIVDLQWIGDEPEGAVWVPVIEGDLEGLMSQVVCVHVARLPLGAQLRFPVRAGKPTPKILVGEENTVVRRSTGHYRGEQS